MEQLSEPLSFFDFDDLSQGEIDNLEEILTGSSTAKPPELPWSIEEQQPYVNEYYPEEEVPHTYVECSLPNGPSDLGHPALVAVTAAPPPQGPIYTAGIPAMVPGIHPQMMTYAGMILPHPLPLNSVGYVPVHMPPPPHHGMPGQALTNFAQVTMAPVPAPMQYPAYQPPVEHHQQHPQVEMPPPGQEKSSNISSNNGGKPYERRNKKRRPPDYYEKLSQREAALNDNKRESPETTQPLDKNGPTTSLGQDTKVLPNTGPGQIPVSNVTQSQDHTGTGPVPVPPHSTYVPPATHRAEAPAVITEPPVPTLAPCHYNPPPPPVNVPPHVASSPPVVNDTIRNNNTVTTTAKDTTKISTDIEVTLEITLPTVSQDISVVSSNTSCPERTTVTTTSVNASQPAAAVVQTPPQQALAENTNTVPAQPVNTNNNAPTKSDSCSSRTSLSPSPQVHTSSSLSSTSEDKAPPQEPAPPARQPSPQPIVAPTPAAAADKNANSVKPEIAPTTTTQSNEQPPQSELSQSAATVSNTEQQPPAQVKTESTDKQPEAVPSPPQATSPPQPKVSPAPAPAPAPAPEKPKVSSWAGLFSGTKSATTATVIYGNMPAPPPSAASSSSTPSEKSASSAKPSPEPEIKKSATEEQDTQIVSASEDKAAKQLGEILKKYKLVHKSVSLQPRGLYNRGNWCYVNATVQALIACPPFYHLLKSLPSFPALTRGPSSTPIIDSMVEFINEFSPMQYKSLQDKPALNAKGTMRQDIQSGSCFEPSYVYKMLQVIKYEAAFKHGKQEDAEEFLSCLLNGLHDEMVAAIKVLDQQDGGATANAAAATNSDAQTNGGLLYQEEVVEAVDGWDGGQDVQEDGWEQVGPKNKSQVTRTAKFDTSPISEMLRGQIRSVLHQPGAKESATLEPFFTLQLDVQGKDIHSVDDALEGLASKEILHGYTCAKTKQEVDATRRLLLEELPPVLVLHLKWFSYDKSGGMQKNVKQVDFTVDLEINKELLSPNVRQRVPQAQRKYKLFAVVNHLGGRAVGGHYIADVFHPGINGWIRCDDSNIHTVPISKVLKFVAPKVPYLLYYRRLDLN